MKPKWALWRHSVFDCRLANIRQKNNLLIADLQLGFNKLMVKIYPAILSAMIGPDHAKKGPSPPIKRSINKFGEEPSNQCMRLNHKEWSRYWASDVIFSADSQFERTQIQEMHACMPINSPTHGKVPVEPVRTSTTSGFEFFSLRKKP